jgi:crossover junction endodeoxyribonuclease RusA
MPSLIFTVYGTPQPQGSMKAFARGKRIIVTSDNTKLEPWRQQVSGTALAAAIDQKFLRIPRPLGVALTLRFYFERPKSVKYPDKSSRPDLDKLERAICDALSGIAYDDDSQVTRVTKSKDFGMIARTEIVVTTAEQRAE